MTDQVARALDLIAVTSDPVALRRIGDNARGKSQIVEKAALRRLASVSADHEAGTLEHDCWSMIHAIEELRRINKRPVSRMNRMRPKIARDGERAALEYCAWQETEGFKEVMRYGLPELTAEAIVLRHRKFFSEKVRSAARARLEAAGIGVNDDGSLRTE